MGSEGRGTDAGRAWWHAALRTERDRRLAIAAGRPITARNLRRLLARRMANVAIKLGDVGQLLTARTSLEYGNE